MFRKTMLSVGFVALFSSFIEARPTPAAADAPVVLGQWHSNLAAAQAKAAELNVPLFVLWGSSSCSHCTAFDSQLDKPACIDYFANRGLVMVYAKDLAVVKKWVGSGLYPLWRLTWPKGGVDARGQYPKSYESLRADIERQIGAYTPGNTDPEPGTPGQIEFVSTPVSVPESAANVVLTLRRVGGTVGTAKVTLSTLDSSSTLYTATAGEDFAATPAPTTLTWASGDSANKTVTITLQKSTKEWEGSETFGVKLTPDLVTLPGLTVGANAVVTLQEVDPLVTAAANYQGWGGALYGEGVLGTVSLSVNAAGNLSGKAVFPVKGPRYAGTYTLKNAAYQTISNGTAWIAGSFSKSGSTLPVTFQVSIKSGRVVGELGSASNAIPLELYRDDWTKSEMVKVAEKFSGYYTMAFPNCCASWPNDAPAGNGYATVTLDKKGRFKVAGKLGDGTTLTQSGTLFLHPDTTVTNPVLCALLYSAPTPYEGGLFGGVINFGDKDTNGVKDVSVGAGFGEALVWYSYNPFSVPVYDAENPGFESELSAIGGWYNSSENLKTHYEGRQLFVDDLAEPPELLNTKTVVTDEGTTREEEPVLATSWQSVESNLTVSVKANGTGFTVSASDLRLLGKDDDGAPLYNYDSAVNPSGLTLTFNRTTGVMAGSFKVYYDYVTKEDTRSDPERLTWKHTQKPASYSSVLLLEQADKTSDVVSSGHYLFPDSSTYKTLDGAVRKYTLNRSYPFVTLSAGIK